MEFKESPKAANRLFDMLDGESRATYSECEDAMGDTDCPEGCMVEADGYCPHGYKSAGLTAGVI